MKRALLCLAFSILLPMGAFAQSQPGPVLTEEQKLQLVEDLKKLGINLVTAPGETPGQAQSNKTMADVLDKVVDLTASAAGVIAAKVQETAPEVWRWFVIQQYAKAAKMLVTPFGVLLVAWAGGWALKRRWKPSDDEPKALWAGGKGSEYPTTRFLRIAITQGLPLITCIIAGFVFVERFSEALPLMINPNYYAAKDIIDGIATILHGR